MMKGLTLSILAALSFVSWVHATEGTGFYTVKTERLP